MTTSNKTALALGLGVALIALVWLLAPEADAPDPDSEARPAVPAPPADAVDAESGAGRIDEHDLIPPPRVAAGGAGETADTTVLWPLEIELRLVRADYLPASDQVEPVGSGATARLSGRIADRRDQGAAGCEVRFVAGPNRGRVLRCDATGAFGSSTLYPGLAIVEVSGPGIQGSRREVRLRQQRDTLLNIGYGRPGHAGGRVLATGGEPIAGARVRFDGQEVYTDADGVFYAGPLAGGEALVEIDADGFAPLMQVVNVTAGATMPVERLTFTLEQATSMRVVVPGDVGGPGPVELYVLPSNPPTSRRFPWYRLNPIEVAAGGVRTIDGLPQEIVKVFAFRPGALAPEKVVNLRTDRVAPIEIALSPAPRLGGRVLADGKPVAGARVRLEAPNRVRAALAFWRQPSWYLEAEVMPELPVAEQEVRTGPDGRFLLTSWSGITEVRYLEARGPTGKSWAGMLVGPSDESVDLELVEADLADASLELELGDRWQALPVEIRVDGTPYDPLVLPAHETLRLEELAGGIYELHARWHGVEVHAEPRLRLEGATERRIELPPEAIEGQDEEAWRRAGRVYPFAASAQ